MQVRSFSIALVTLSITALPAAAAPDSKSGAPKAPHGNPHTVTSVKSTGPKTTAAPKTTGNPHATAPTTTKTTTPTTTTTTTTPPNPIATKIASKPNLSTKIQAMLPGSMTLDQASRGFKNQGQFIAALHVSQNLGIPFADLKTAMTGLSPTAAPGTQPTTPTLSLGQAIQKLRPAADATTASRTAERQANDDVVVMTAPKAPKKRS